MGAHFGGSYRLGVRGVGVMGEVLVSDWVAGELGCGIIILATQEHKSASCLFDNFQMVTTMQTMRCTDKTIQTMDGAARSDNDNNNQESN